MCGFINNACADMLNNRQLIGCVLMLVSHLIGCGHDPRIGATIEPPFVPYVQEFEKQCNCKVLDIPVTFQEIDEHHAGECWDYDQFFDGYQEIFIDKEWWDKANNDNKEQLIFHELGHCRLHRVHDKRRSGLFPISLMYPSIGEIPHWYYSIYRLEYFDELFRRGQYRQVDTRQAILEK